jgi:hypothetical protein
MGPWWGLVDENLFFIPNFVVCPRDKANIEALFPTLKGAFTRIPESMRAPHLCSMRPESRRFPLYLDTLDSINDEALEKYLRRSATSSSWDLRPIKLTGSADPRRLIDQARSFSTKPECPHNKSNPDGLWHYMPDVPDLTVCPDCYEHIVRPELKSNSVVSTLFTRTPQQVALPISTAAALSRLPTLGPTCQLYSPRMQQVWQEAVNKDDVELLVRKMRERRTMETHLYHKKVDLESLLHRAGSYMKSGIDREMLKRDLARLEKDWEMYE